MGPTTATTPDTPTGRNLVTLLATTTSTGVLEQARTVLSRYASTADPNQAPQTFGEVAHSRTALELQAQQAVTIVAALTLLIAGCMPPLTADPFHDPVNLPSPERR